MFCTPLCPFVFDRFRDSKRLHRHASICHCCQIKKQLHLLRVPFFPKKKCVGKDGEISRRDGKYERAIFVIKSSIFVPINAELIRSRSF